MANGPAGYPWAPHSTASRARTIIAVVSTIYVTGHRNPDTDSVASAIGYAELKRRLVRAFEITSAKPKRRR